MSVTYIGHRLLGVTAGWELFGLGPDSMVSIQFARGRITRTKLPPPLGSGPVSLIVGPHQAIIRPIDNVPGYLVPDGEAARRLTGTLATGALLLPGPRPTQEWVVSGRSNSLPLLGPEGQRTRVSIALPPPWPAQSAMADGRGDVLLFDDHGGQYDAGPHWLSRVGALLDAVGPTRWLGETCPRSRCRNLVIDIATGARQVLPGPALQLLTWPWPWEPGVVSPDGATAAVVVATGGSSVGLDLISLTTGATSPVAVPISQATSSQALAWSPDSRWLFVVTPDGKLVAVDARTKRVRGLGVALPDISQVAVRAG